MEEKFNKQKVPNKDMQEANNIQRRIKFPFVLFGTLARVYISQSFF